MRSMNDGPIVVPSKKPRDPIAKDLRTPKYRMKVVQPKKGKGSFDKKKHRQEDILR